MELWFSEQHTDNVKLSIKIDKQLVHRKSRYQSIDVFETAEFGKLLTLDGFVMLTEKDEFIYHEMIVHVAMSTNRDIKNVLVIGAGDGGTIRELVKYDNIKNIDMVEIDEEVVNVCREYIPSAACALDDERLSIFYEDGLKFVRRMHDKYDLIIVDSTDPFGPGEGLFTKEFYGNCHKALTENGILINQHESPFYDNDALSMKRAHKRIKSVFEVSKVYQFHMPTYPSGHWLFGFASKGIDPVKDMIYDYTVSKGIKTRYYNSEIHKGAFALPNYVIDMLEGE